MMDPLFPKPIIVIVSSSSTKPKSLIKLLTGVNIQHNEEIEIQQSWPIDTKYYTTNVDIFGITENYVRSDKFNDKVEALIIHMDTNKESGLEDVERWSSIEKDCNPEIKLLICNYCTPDTKISKVKAVEWCLKRGFELIELYPDVSNNQGDNDDDDELIKEKFGVDRVIEALQTHMWSNLSMKEKCERPTYLDSNVVNDSSSNSLESNLVDDKAVFENLVGKDACDDFIELFSQLHMVKESMKSLPDTQRKQCAENMVTAFWHAIGGDEEELSDL